MVDEVVEGELPTDLPDEVVIDKVGPIRRFTDARINESVTQALALIPAGKTVATVAIATKSEVKGAIVWKAGNNFTAMGVVELPNWKLAQMKAQAVVVWTPF